MVDEKSAVLEHQGLTGRLEACETQFDIFRLLREITSAFGLSYFFIADIGAASEQPFSELTVITSAPADLLQRYEGDGVDGISPLRSLMKLSSAPFEFRPGSPMPTFPDDRGVIVEAFCKDQDLDCWFFTPVYHPDHGQAVVSFLGKRGPLSFTEKAELCLYAQLVHEKLRHVSAKPVRAHSTLTDRERECLVWTAAGKTSSEIARILGLSEHTVNHYLNNAARKLDAVNRTQAVVFALRNGFID